MSGVVSFSRITVMDVIKSFCYTGIFPFGRNYPRRFKPACSSLHDDSGSNSHGRPVSEIQTVKEVDSIMETADDAARKLQSLSILLHNRKTTNSIVMRLGEDQRERNAHIGESASGSRKNVAILSGSRSEYLTVGETLLRRREVIDGKERALKEKEDAKKERENARILAKQKKIVEKESKDTAKRAKRLEKKDTRERGKQNQEGVSCVLKCVGTPERLSRNKRAPSERTACDAGIVKGGSADIVCLAFPASSPTKSPARKVGRILDMQ